MNADEFFSSLDKDRHPGCWLWILATWGGYGVLSIGGKNWRAHRYAYELVKGPIPPGMFVCHSCDVRNCCNPDHLWLGTAADNSQDAWEKGRAVVPAGHHYRITGHLHPASKLTKEQREELCVLADGGMSYRELAKRFNVSVPVAYYARFPEKQRVKRIKQKSHE